ncbi:hypothetical protein ABT56_12075 [Photobacterium aquae]|uniref:Ribosome alternative rescue factor ArfA n=1 Tax=Photobacterium aquae TaxID=1195763 RepID=A0A0J1JT78_9GAMM|nr:ribosome alternative rescue factor ArfA [Photobacterium aquae]KLV05487.1 hypothetical protein ABT56_12075 [Photobacterium aquae]
MAKKRKQYAQIDDDGKVLSSTPVIETETGRGTVRDNALKAVVTSSLFRTRVVKSKKGKGSFVRKDKHKGRESYSMAA